MHTYIQNYIDIRLVYSRRMFYLVHVLDTITANPKHAFNAHMRIDFSYSITRSRRLIRHNLNHSWSVALCLQLYLARVMVRVEIDGPRNATMLLALMSRSHRLVH